MIMTKDFILKCRASQRHDFPVDDFGHDVFWRDFEDPELIQTFVVPNQSPNQEVFMNENGFLANDIQKLLEAERNGDLLRSQYYQSKLMTPGNVNYLPSDMSEDDMFNSTPSRYAQDVTELVADSERISSTIDRKVYEHLENEANKPSVESDLHTNIESNTSTT